MIESKLNLIKDNGYKLLNFNTTNSKNDLKYFVSFYNGICVFLACSFKEINQSVQMLEAIYNYAITNQKGRDIPLLCKKNYSLQPCTFEAGVHYLELVQSALHRHKYTHFSDHNCEKIG